MTDRRMNVAENTSDTHFLNWHRHLNIWHIRIKIGRNCRKNMNVHRKYMIVPEEVVIDTKEGGTLINKLARTDTEKERSYYNK